MSARDRLYLLGGFPTLVVWGERDNTIPLQHGREAHEAIPGSRFVTLPRAAHFPHLEDPAGLAEVLSDFMETTEPALIEDRDRAGPLWPKDRAVVEVDREAMVAAKQAGLQRGRGGPGQARRRTPRPGRILRRRRKRQAVTRAPAAL